MTATRLLPFSPLWGLALLLAGSQSAATPAPARLPVIAIVADSAGTELTDFMVPHATLTEAGIARVVVVALHPGRIRLVPGRISIEPDLTMAAFDSANARGADYVIVPAMVNHENWAIADWIRGQAARGAIIVSICEGARTAALAGVFDGRRATTHWSAMKDLEKKYPGTTWVRDQRYVADERVVSTTGVSAALPASIYLIDRIAGRAAADSAARRLGVASWGPGHETAAFGVTKWMYVKGAFNYVAPWRHDRIGVPVADGFDEVSLAFTVDAVARTLRGKPFTWSEDGAPVRGRQGLRISVDRPRSAVTAGTRDMALSPRTVAPAAALDSVIAHLTDRYGSDAAALIEMGMEYLPSQRGSGARRP
ncbi:MAG: ThiJ/PfpI domain protein [Gemmatimonadetes bacterium]|nr:ThiJ/PfpI domain protein [Gemmatimonadota bacterium]